jgi:hypothetical protein
VELNWSVLEPCKEVNKSAHANNIVLLGVCPGKYCCQVKYIDNNVDVTKNDCITVEPANDGMKYLSWYFKLKKSNNYFRIILKNASYEKLTIYICVDKLTLNYCSSHFKIY